MIKRLIIVLLALGVVFGGIVYFKYQRIKMMSAHGPPPPATVASARVEAESWQPYLHSVGSLVASQGVDVSNEIDGQVVAIHFQSGQPVKEGEVLVKLDDDVDQAQLKGLIAEQRLADIAFKRSARLVKQHSVSQSDYDQAQANLESARANVQSKREQIKEKAIRAPFSGILGIRQVDLGEYLAKGARIVSLQALDPIFVDFSLPERELPRLRQDQPVELQVQAFPDETFTGHITAIEPRINTGTRNIRVRATLANPHSKLRPGMFAEVRVVLPKKRDILTLPRTAVTYNPYGDMVYIIEEKDGKLTVHSRQIQTGTSRDKRVEVVTGLKAGDRVVRAGQVKLRNGQHIQIDNSVNLDKHITTP